MKHLNILIYESRQNRVDALLLSAIKNYDHCQNSVMQYVTLKQQGLLENTILRKYAICTKINKIGKLCK